MIQNDDLYLSEGLKRKLVGFQLDGRRVPRHGMAIFSGGREVGRVTSGTFSPSMQQAIALARVPMGVNVGDTVHVEIRDKKLAASVVKLPFVRNGKILAA